MTDALINNKPQFVRLFTENGLSIMEYLTYGRLENLFRSVADGTVLYQLLQCRLVERLGTSPPVPTFTNLQDSSNVAAGKSSPVADISLFEVCFFSDERNIHSSGLVLLQQNHKECEGNLCLHKQF